MMMQKMNRLFLKLELLPRSPIPTGLSSEICSFLGSLSFEPTIRIVISISLARFFIFTVLPRCTLSLLISLSSIITAFLRLASISAILASRIACSFFASWDF